MKQPDPTIYVVAAITFVVLLLMRPSPMEQEMLAMLASEVSRNSHFTWFLAIAALAGMPLAFAVPSLQASFMGRSWKVPSTAYVIPRWALRLFIGIVAGQALATLTLGIWSDHRLLWLLPLHLFVGGAFCIGAWRRLRKPASAEFTMPWWPPLRGRFR